MAQETFPGRVEIAPGADLDASQWSYTWTDITADTDQSEVSITAGTPDLAADLQSTTVSVKVNNGSGKYTPGHTSAVHAEFGDGTPFRYSLRSGDPHLVTTGHAGSQLTTPDAASLDVTSDHWGAVEIVAPFSMPKSGDSYGLFGKGVFTGNDFSWGLYLLDSGLAQLSWSTTGAAAGIVSALTSIPVPRPQAGPFTLAWHIDVNNGASGHTVKWWCGRMSKADLRTAIIAGDTSIVLGDSWVGSGTTSVFASGSKMWLGGDADADASLYPGTIRAAEQRSGDWTGTVVANPDITTRSPGDTTWADTAGVPKTWTVQGDAVVTDYQVRFVGELGAIQREAPGHGVAGTAQATLVANSSLSRMRQGEKPFKSVIYRAVMAQAAKDPTTVPAYWPMEDASGSGTFFSPIDGVAPATYGGEISLASNTDLAASSAVPGVSGGQGYGWLGKVPVITATNWQATKFQKLTTLATSPAETILFEVKTTGTIRAWRLTVNTAVISLQGYDVAGTQVYLNNVGLPAEIDDGFGQWNWSFAQNGANIDFDVTFLSINGNVYGTGTLSTAGTLGRPIEMGTLTTAPGADGTAFGHAAITTGLTYGWLGWNTGANGGYLREEAAERFLRLAQEEGEFVAVHSDPDTGGSEEMGVQRPDVTFTGQLREAALADIGIQFEQRTERGIGYRTRRSIYNQDPRWVVDSGVVQPFKVSTDTSKLVNDIIVSRQGGSSARAVAAASVARHDTYDAAPPVNVATDQQLPGQAAWRLHEGTSPDARIEAFTIEIAKDAALEEGWLGIALGDVIELTNVPDWESASSDPLRQVVRWYQERITQHTWTVSILGSPAGVYDVGIAEDDTLGKADSAGSELHTGVNTSATSLDVAVTAGPAWTVSDPEFPFEVVIGDETLEVSDIAASLVTFGAAGAAAHASNASVTPGAPAGVAVGNLLLCLAAIRNSGTGTVNTPSGWTRQPGFTTADNVGLFARIADGTAADTPTVSFSGGVANATTSAQLIRLGGSWHGVTNIVAASRAQLNGSGQDIAYPALYVPEPNCIILYLGWKQDDWTSVATIAGATEIGEPSSVLGDDQGIVWDYVIQTTATNIAAGSFTVTGGATAISRGAVIAIRSDRQTWTVSRSENAISQSHSAGDAVSLRHPMVAAL